MEIWRDIPGYEGIYQASSHGQIRTVEGKVTSNKRYGVRHWKSRVLKGRGSNPITGKRVSLWKDGQSRDFLVARIVALTFLGEPQEGFTVNHKDGNRFNNMLENLEWLSLADNIKHGFETGLYPQKKVVVSRACSNNTLSFRSLSQLSRFLGRSDGYASERLKRSRTSLTDSNGVVYTIVKVG
jgi:hypothetical protein